MFMGMLWVIDLEVYTLLDPSVTMSFVTPHLAIRFDICSIILVEPFFDLYTRWCFNPSQKTL